VHLDATEHNDNIVFLHNIRQGPASKSYGLQVAKLAGIPSLVLESAKQPLANLEPSGSKVSTDALTASESLKPSDNLQQPNKRGKSSAADALQADLFAQSSPSLVEERLKNLSLDNLTPLAALQTLYDLKALVKK